MQQNYQAHACYSDCDLVELAPLPDDLIIEVSNEELPIDFFEGFFDELDQISTLPQDFFDEFFEELDKVSTLPQDFFDEFFGELDKVPLPKVRKRISNSPKKAKKLSNPRDNETRTFLYDPSTNVYEIWREKFTEHYNKNLYFFLPSEKADDVVSEFLTWIVKKDKLKGHTKVIEKKFNWVKSVMFKQFVTQYRQKSAQCALYRNGDGKARTEQENKLFEAGVALTKHFQVDTANVVLEEDSETGNLEVDINKIHYPSSSSEVEDEVEKREVHEIVFDAFASSTQTQEEAQLLYDVFIELAEKNYRTEAQWAEQWGVEVKELKKLKYKVKNTIKENKVLKGMYT